MAIADDFTIDYINKRITHTAGTTVYSVNALYSWLQDVFDEPSQMDDENPMSAQTPTAYSLINGWFMDDTSFEFLTGGAVATIGWDAATYSDGIRHLQFEATGYVNAVATDIGKPVLGGVTGDSGTLVAYDNTRRYWCVRVDDTGDTFQNGTETISITGGTGSGNLDDTALSSTGENLWSNVYTLGTLEAGSQIYIVQDAALISAWWTTGHIDILVKVKEAGTEIDGANISVFCRNYTDLYDHFKIDLSAGGRNAVPLATFDDLNNQTAAATIEDYTDGTLGTVTFTFGATTKDIGDGAGLQPYDVVIDCDGKSLAIVYEVTKWVTREGSTYNLNGVNGDRYISVDPADPVSYPPIKAAPFGTFAGGTFFGATGVWIENLHPDDIQDYQLIDSNGVTRNPPNYQTVEVGGLGANDQVAVFRTTGNNFIIDQALYTSHATNNTSGTATFEVQSAIASDTPSEGYFRVKRADGTEDRYHYSSFTGAIFTLDVTDHPTGLSATYDGTDTVYIPYIDTIASAGAVGATWNSGDGKLFVTITYAADRTVMARVRQKGILPFQTKGNLTATGYNATAIRTSDTIVT